MTESHVVIVGNPVDGIMLYGPFTTRDDAIDWCDSLRNMGGDYWVAPIAAPDHAPS